MSFARPRCSFGFKSLMRNRSFLFRALLLSKVTYSSSESVNTSWSIYFFPFISPNESSTTIIGLLDVFAHSRWKVMMFDVSIYQVMYLSFLPWSNLLSSGWWPHGTVFWIVDFVEFGLSSQLWQLYLTMFHYLFEQFFNSFFWKRMLLCYVYLSVGQVLTFFGFELN